MHKMNKTIEEMVQELDDKFGHFKEIYKLSNSQDYLDGNYEDIEGVYCDGAIEKKCEKYLVGIEFDSFYVWNLKNEIEIYFHCTNEDTPDLFLDLITKVYNYFITQGNEL